MQPPVVWLVSLSELASVHVMKSGSSAKKVPDILTRSPFSNTGGYLFGEQDMGAEIS